MIIEVLEVSVGGQFAAMGYVPIAIWKINLSKNSYFLDKHFKEILLPSNEWQQVNGKLNLDGVWNWL